MADQATPDRPYDGAHYHVEEYYVCDCGFSTARGAMLPNGSYPGGKIMVAHLEAGHGWVSGRGQASYRGDWGRRR